MAYATDRSTTSAYAAIAGMAYAIESFIVFAKNPIDRNTMPPALTVVIFVPSRLSLYFKRKSSEIL